jgi:hypothetical protein
VILIYKISYNIGSGATGWVKSAMNIEADLIRDIIWEKEKRWIEDGEAKTLSDKMASKYNFKKNDKNLLYFIREPIIQTEEDRKKTYKGFSKKIKLQSIMGSSILIVDGGIASRQVSFGATFSLTPATSPLNSLHLTF